MSEVRIPTQKRSIEKRDRIIEKGFYLMCSNGYYNTNTNDIAKYAGVSTGIIYQYFNDKKDIFVEGFKSYSNKILFPILDVLDTSISFDNFSSVLDSMFDVFIEKHTLSLRAHEEMIGLCHLDRDIAKIFHDKEIETTKKIVEVLKKNNCDCDNLFERVHIAIGMVENYCHEVVYHKHDDVDYNVMRNEVIKTIRYLFNF